MKQRGRKNESRLTRSGTPEAKKGGSTAVLRHHGRLHTYRLPVRVIPSCWHVDTSNVQIGC